MGWDCTKCGHQHAGRELANICIGCPCPETQPEIMSVVYPHGSCRQCGVCEGEPHHWLENSIDPDDSERVAQWLSEHPQIANFGIDLTELLLAHYECKHCPAVRTFEVGELRI